MGSKGKQIWISHHNYQQTILKNLSEYRHMQIHSIHMALPQKIVLTNNTWGGYYICASIQDSYDKTLRFGDDIGLCGFFHHGICPGCCERRHEKRKDQRQQTIERLFDAATDV